MSLICKICFWVTKSEALQINTHLQMMKLLLKKKIQDLSKAGESQCENTQQGH